VFIFEKLLGEFLPLHIISELRESELRATYFVVQIPSRHIHMLVLAELATVELKDWIRTAPK